MIGPDCDGAGDDVAVFLVVACLTAEPPTGESEPEPHSEEQQNDRSHAAFSFPPRSGMGSSLHLRLAVVMSHFGSSATREEIPPSAPRRPGRPIRTVWVAVGRGVHKLGRP